MTFTYQHQNDRIRFSEYSTGATQYTKVSFPVKYGRFSEIQTPDVHFTFNLNHEIRHARARTPDWIHPSEWLKRSVSNDWIYYSTGGYTGVSESIGEYYLPNFMYPTNNLLGGHPFENPLVSGLVSGWYDILKDIIHSCKEFRDDHPQFCQSLLRITPAHLQSRALSLESILGRRITVLPPDARHVDYDILPVNISDGCLHKCRFCRVKNPVPFTPRTRQQVDAQISRIKALYAEDILNYNAVFLGEHDALAAPDDLILYAAARSFSEFETDRSVMQGKNLFMFGSVQALLNKTDAFFSQLSSLGCMTWINIGLESAHQPTLDLIGKSILQADVRRAFARIQQINAAFESIEITCNFLMGDQLEDDHYKTFLSLARDSVMRQGIKGTIYLSPMEFDAPSREKVMAFNRLKTLSRLPTFLYIIQRL